MQSVTSNAVAQALKRTVYQSGTGSVSNSSGNIRTITNIPKGIYIVHYGFGYVQNNNNLLCFTSTDPQAIILTSLTNENRTGWLGELTDIMVLPNGGNISLSMYSSGTYIEQSNGAGLSAVKIGDV